MLIGIIGIILSITWSISRITHSIKKDIDKKAPFEYVDRNDDMLRSEINKNEQISRDTFKEINQKLDKLIDKLL